MGLPLLSCCLETLIPLAPSLGAECSLLVSLGNESSLTVVRSGCIIQMSDFWLDSRDRSMDHRPIRCLRSAASPL